MDVIRDVALLGLEGRFAIGMENGSIAAIESRLEPDGGQTFEGAGSLLVPGLLNPHLHLDKCLLGQVLAPNVTKSRRESRELTWEHKRRYTEEEVITRATRVVDAAIVNGTTGIRAFADVDTIGGLVGIKALLELKRRYESQILLQTTIYPQEGIFTNPGADRLMEEALTLGADVVGGSPGHERTEAQMQAHIDFCLDLAKRFDRDLHFMIDDTDDPYSRSLEYLAVRTIEESYQGRVVAGQCGALASYDHAHADRVISLVREANITVCCNPHISLILSGRNDRGRVRRGITRVRELLAAGVNVIAGQDDIDDPFYPFGRPDQLEVGLYMAHVAQLSHPTDLPAVFDMVTVNAARALRIPDYGLAVGDRADLVVLQAQSLKEAFRLVPPRRWVFFQGKLAAETIVTSKRYGPSVAFEDPS